MRADTLGQIFFEEGERKGLLRGIRLMLKLRFGSEDEKLMTCLEDVMDNVLLEKTQDHILAAQNMDEFLSLLVMDQIIRET